MLEEAHKRSSRKHLIEAADKCGCFFCLRIFDASEVREYVGTKHDVALCPRCGIDSLLDDKGDYELTGDFLQDMRDRWFAEVP
jgi:hypothetical protein